MDFEQLQLESIDNSKQCTLKVGDRVVTKRTGYPTVGIVVAVMDGVYFVHMYGCTVERNTTTGEFRTTYQNEEAYKLWTMLYPNWMFNAVAYIRFDEPQKPTSELDLKTVNPEFSDDVIQYKMERIPKAISAVYPIADLELFE